MKNRKSRNRAEKAILEALGEEDTGQTLAIWCPEHRCLTTVNDDGSPRCDGKPHANSLT